MTPEQIVGLALCAGAETQDGGKHWEFDSFNPRTFARLIEAATREECARVCRNLIANQSTSDSIKAAKEVANLCAEAIEGMK